jgi:hypothetical protein
MYIVVITPPHAQRDNCATTTHTSDAIVGVAKENIFLVNAGFLSSSIYAYVTLREKRVGC